MDKILVKLRQAVARERQTGPMIADVHSRTMSFRSYRWVLAVVAIVAVYYAFLASDMYVSDAQVYVKSTDQQPVAAQVQFLPGGGGESSDALLVQAFLRSRDLMEIMDREIGFTEHFASTDHDMYSRLDANASAEDRLTYFRSRFSASLNPDTGIITLRGQGYTPEFSLQLVQTALSAAETYINDVGHRIAAEEIGFVETELDRARNNIGGAQAKLVDFQNENGILSADATGESKQALVLEMENDLVRLLTEEKALTSYLNPGAAEVVAVRSRIAALTSQLVVERAKLASTDGVSANDINAEARNLELELKFATDIYKAALVALERARIESFRKLKHLVVVQSPQLPDAAILPRKLYHLMTLFIALTLAYGIITMILATIREHRDV